MMEVVVDSAAPRSERETFITEMSQLVVKVVESAGVPLSVTGIKKHLTVSIKEPDLIEIVEQAVAQQKLFPVGKFNNKETYWVRPLEEFAKDLICQKLEKEPLTAYVLRSKVEKRLSSYTPKDIDQLLIELVKSGRLNELPLYPNARTNLFSTQPPQAINYLHAPVQKIVKKLIAVGLSRADIVAGMKQLATELEESDAPAMPPTKAHVPAPESEAKESSIAQPETSSGSELTETIMSRLDQIDANPGAMIDLGPLRALNEFQHTTREEFDAALWELVKTSQLNVHEHRSVGLLNEQKRAALLRNAQGQYFHAVSRRTR